MSCEVLNVDPRAAPSAEYIRISGGLGLAGRLVRHAMDGWVLHVHINGHNPKGWAIALAGGLAAQAGEGGVLTIHSGIAPQYLRECSSGERALAQMACMQFERVVCVNDEIARTVARTGVPPQRLEIFPAFLPLEAPRGSIPMELQGWLSAHRPVLATAVFFRPEYGVDLLVRAVQRLAGRYPRLGCLVMGSGEERVAAEMHIERAGLKDSVRLVGDVDHETCLALMSRSDVFVRATWRDGDSISVREAVSLGVPVVASNAGTRPAEALLFEAGDIEGLAAQIGRALNNESQQVRAGIPSDPADRLFGLYSI